MFPPGLKKKLKFPATSSSFFWSSLNILTTPKGTWYPQVGTIQFQSRKKEKPPICLERHLKPGLLPCSADQHSFLVGSKLATIERLSVLPVRQADVGAARRVRLLESPQRAAGGRLTATTLRVWDLWALPASRCPSFRSGVSERPPRRGGRKHVGKSRAEVLAQSRSSQPLVAARLPRSLSLWANRGRSSPPNRGLFGAAHRKQGLAYPVSMVSSPLPQGCRWLCTKWRKVGIWLWAGRCVLRPNCPCVSSPRFVERVRVRPWTWDKVFCRNAFHDTQVR